MTELKEILAVGLMLSITAIPIVLAGGIVTFTE
jgi:hypothetical protein